MKNMRVFPGLSLELDDDDLITAVIHECHLRFCRFVSFVIFENSFNRNVVLL